MGDCFKAFVFLGSIITSKIHTSVNCVVCLLVQVCEHDYIDGPNLNKTLMTAQFYNFRILEQKFKLISCDENYTKSNISLTLGLTVIKSPPRIHLFEVFLTIEEFTSIPLLKN
jgi:hypothetical protein